MEGLTDAGHEFRITKITLIAAYRREETRIKKLIEECQHGAAMSIDGDNFDEAKEWRAKERANLQDLKNLYTAPFVACFSFTPEQLLSPQTMDVASNADVTKSFYVGQETPESDYPLSICLYQNEG